MNVSIEERVVGFDKWSEMLQELGRAIGLIIQFRPIDPDGINENYARYIGVNEGRLYYAGLIKVSGVIGMEPRQFGSKADVAQYVADQLKLGGELINDGLYRLYFTETRSINLILN